MTRLSNKVHSRAVVPHYASRKRVLPSKLLIGQRSHAIIQNMPYTPSVAITRKAEVLRRLRQGDFLLHIANDLGIRRQSIVAALRRHPAQRRVFDQARLIGARHRYTVARGRIRKWEQFRYLHWFGPDEFAQRMGFAPRQTPAQQVLGSTNQAGPRQQTVRKPKSLIDKDTRDPAKLTVSK